MLASSCHTSGVRVRFIHNDALLKAIAPCRSCTGWRKSSAQQWSCQADRGRGAVSCAAAPPETAPASPQAASQPEDEAVFFKEGDFVEVGIISGAFGTKGEARIKVLTDDPGKRFVPGTTLYLAPAKMPPPPAQTPLRKVTIMSTKTRVLPRGIAARVCKFTGVDSPEEVALLRNFKILLQRQRRFAIQDPDTFYLQDLIGCKVFDQATKRAIGTVTDACDGTGTHDTLTVQLRPTADDIRKSQIRTSLMPFVKVICPVVDVAAQRMEVNAPEGLFDINTVRKTRKPLTAEQIEDKLKQLADEQQKEDAWLQASRPATARGSPAAAAASTSSATAAPDGASLYRVPLDKYGRPVKGNFAQTRDGKKSTKVTRAMRKAAGDAGREADKQKYAKRSPSSSHDRRDGPARNSSSGSYGSRPDRGATPAPYTKPSSPISDEPITPSGTARAPLFPPAESSSSGRSEVGRAGQPGGDVSGRRSDAASGPPRPASRLAAADARPAASAPAAAARVVGAAVSRRLRRVSGARPSLRGSSLVTRLRSDAADDGEDD